MYINKFNLQVAKVASKESVRYQLTGVLFDPRNNRTIASDGKRLIEVRNKDVSMLEDHPIASHVKADTKPFIVPLGKKLGELQRQIATKSPVRALEWLSVEKITEQEVKGGDPIRHVTLASTDLETRTRTELRLINGTFPNCDAVKPRPDSAKATIVVDADLLADTLNAVDISNGKTPVLLSVHENQVVLESANDDTGQESYAVVMGLSKEATPSHLRERVDGKPSKEDPKKEPEKTAPVAEKPGLKTPKPVLKAKMAKAIA